MSRRIEYPVHIKRFFERWEDASLKNPAYMVGGYVRDALLGFASKDADIASAEDARTVAEHFAGTEIEVRRTYARLGTVVLSQEYGGKHYPYEYTQFRTDSYPADGTHRPDRVYFSKDIRTDALRRDFTINALYADHDGIILDPTERGLRALSNQTIEQISEQTMKEDALRVLRMVRFAARLLFRIDEGTFAAAKAAVPNLKDISKERIYDELVKILTADSAYGKADGVLYGLHLLRDLGALPYVLPALANAKDVRQNPDYHAYDVLEHSFRTCACAPRDLPLRLAALLHDCGKPDAMQQYGRMLGHESMGAQKAYDMLTELKAPIALRDETCALIQNHMFDLDNTARKKAVLKRLRTLGYDGFEKLCALREADFYGSGMGHDAASAQKWREIARDAKQKKAPLCVADLAVNGRDLMRELNLRPGKRIGELLSGLLDYTLKNPAQNNYKSLIRYAKMLNKSICQ